MIGESTKLIESVPWTWLRSLHVKEFDLEKQGGIGGYGTAGATGPVAEFRWY